MTQISVPIKRYRSKESHHRLAQFVAKLNRHIRTRFDGLQTKPAPRYLDDAVAALRSSYILHDDGSHEHDENAFPCNIIEATQDGEHGFIVGRIVVPELVDYFSLHPESVKR